MAKRLVLRVYFPPDVLSSIFIIYAPQWMAFAEMYTWWHEVVHGCARLWTHFRYTSYGYSCAGWTAKTKKISPLHIFADMDDYISDMG
jgi:hypothetical protein